MNTHSNSSLLSVGEYARVNGTLGLVTAVGPAGLRMRVVKTIIDWELAGLPNCTAVFAAANAGQPYAECAALGGFGLTDDERIFLWSAVDTLALAGRVPALAG